MAIDGTSFDVPGTGENAAAAGKMGSGPRESAFQKLQVVSLSECGTHAQVAAAMGSCRAGERELAARLAGPVQENMLITADAGSCSWQLRDLYAATGAALCWRAGAAVALPLVRRLPDGSCLGADLRAGQHGQAQGRPAGCRAPGNRSIRTGPASSARWSTPSRTAATRTAS